MLTLTRILTRGQCLQAVKLLGRTENQAALLSTKTAKQPVDEQKEQNAKGEMSETFTNFRFRYPEFLPDPNPERRNALRERLERSDMMARRKHVDLPEFYVGSILEVTYSDKHAPGKTNKFVGICIQRQYCGLKAEFTLRNIVEGEGVDIMFHLYDPTITNIRVLRLEKRLDDELLYLRDCPHEYSYFPFDMEAEILPAGAAVPVNKVIVPLNPQPWVRKYELKMFKGVVPDTVTATLSQNRIRKFKLKIDAELSWQHLDLMKEYRETIPEEEQKVIYDEVNSSLQQLEAMRKKIKRKRQFSKPAKKG